jgi:hypothetical protein
MPNPSQFLKNAHQTGSPIVKDSARLAAALSLLYQNQLAMASVLGEVGGWIADHGSLELSGKINEVMREVISTNQKMMPHLQAILTQAVLEIEAANENTTH